jgi:hypothetical protein
MRMSNYQQFLAAVLTVRQAAVLSFYNTNIILKYQMTSPLLPAALLLTLAAGLSAAEIAEPDVTQTRKPVSAVPS